MTCSNLWECVAAPLQYEFIRNSLIAAIIIGVVCAFVGAFVVLQDLAFIGDALAHASFPGAVIAFMFNLNLAIGGAVAGLLTALGIGVIVRRSKVSQDTAIGVLFAGTFALGVLLFSRIKNNTKDLFGLLLGDVLAIRSSDLIVIGIMGLIVIGTILALYKELTLMTFDRLQAEVIGLPVAWLHELLLALMAITIVIAVQTVGIVLVVAMLVTPAATATLLVRRFPMVILVGAVQGVIGTVAGLYISYYMNVASGASMVLVMTLMFAMALVFSRLRGRFRQRRAAA
ncbi:metal ABC transporter permease [Chloroflexia bacterium SDU3-3]|nr:metal ABC transporter permease [Chloroflexia bacterium SDU3-3]